MSLLMDALKQQASQQADATPGAAAPVAAPTARTLPRWWLFVVVGTMILVLGVMAGLWLNRLLLQPRVAEVPAVAAVVVPVTPATVPPASPGLILSDLLAQPTSEELAAAAEQEQLVISSEVSEPQSHGQTLDEQVATLTGEAQMQDEFPEGRVLGAGRQMQEADPSAPVADASHQSREVKDFGSTPTRELSANDVPQDLRDKFQSAMDALASEPKQPKVSEYAAPARDVQSLDDIIQRQIPPLRFEAHVYATEPMQRWVKVNGKDLQEGQWITADIQLKEITPQYVLMQTGRQMFSMPALSEWSYRGNTGR